MNQLTITNHDGIDVVESTLVAKATSKQHKDLMRDIRGYIEVMEGTESNERKFAPVDFFIPSTYKDAKGEERPCYLLTKKGCDMVANKMTGEKGVLFTAAYVTAFEQMREHIQTGYGNLSPQLQLLINLETQQKEQAAALAAVNQKVDNISEIVSLDANAWRDKTNSIIVKIAEAWGGRQHIPDVHKELYRLLESTARINLKRRLDNRKKAMLMEGAPKSKVANVNNRDIIADDPKLVPIYLGLVKDMAIKNSVNVQGMFEEMEG